TPEPEPGPEPLAPTGRDRLRFIVTVLRRGDRLGGKELGWQSYSPNVSIGLSSSAQQISARRIASISAALHWICEICCLCARMLIASCVLLLSVCRNSGGTDVGLRNGVWICETVGGVSVDSLSASPWSE